MSHPNCLKEAAILPCPLKFIMPVHYALTNEEAPPPWYGFSNVRESGLLELENHKYTLKTIKQGLIFVEWDAVKDDPVVYQCTNGTYKELTKYGYPSRKYLLTVPDDPSITKIRMLYIRTIAPDETQSIDGNKIEPAWHEIKAHLKGKPERYQTITLWEKPYSGALSEVAPLVEEFREGQGELHYLPSWAECASILHADQRRNEVIVPAGPHGSSKLVPPRILSPIRAMGGLHRPGTRRAGIPTCTKELCCCIAP